MVLGRCDTATGCADQSIESIHPIAATCTHAAAERGVASKLRARRRQPPILAQGPSVRADEPGVARSSDLTDDEWEVIEPFHGVRWPSDVRSTPRQVLGGEPAVRRRRRHDPFDRAQCDQVAAHLAALRGDEVPQQYLWVVQPLQ